MDRFVAFVGMVLVVAGALLLPLNARPQQAKGTPTLPPHAEHLSELSIHERVVVKLESTGCFHTAISYYEIMGTTPVQVTVRNPDGTLVGTVKLNDSELKRLDALLAFYRAGTEGGCTTVENINVTWYFDNNAVRTENFTDASCSVESLGPMVLTFWEIHQRADVQPQKK